MPITRFANSLCLPARFVLTWQVLLMVHNTFHYEAFFAGIRAAVGEGRLGAFDADFVAAYGSGD